MQYRFDRTHVVQSGLAIVAPPEDSSPSFRRKPESTSLERELDPGACPGPRSGVAPGFRRGRQDDDTGVIRQREQRALSNRHWS